MEQLNCERVEVARAMQLSSGVTAPAGKLSLQWKLSMHFLEAEVKLTDIEKSACPWPPKT